MHRPSHSLDQPDNIRWRVQIITQSSPVSCNFSFGPKSQATDKQTDTSRQQAGHCAQSEWRPLMWPCDYVTTWLCPPVAQCAGKYAHRTDRYRPMHTSDLNSDDGHQECLRNVGFNSLLKCSSAWEDFDSFIDQSNVFLIILLNICTLSGGNYVLSIGRFFHWSTSFTPLNYALITIFSTHVPFSQSL